MKLDANQQRRRVALLNLLAVASFTPPAIFGLAILASPISREADALLSGILLLFAVLFPLWFFGFPIILWVCRNIAKETQWTPLATVLTAASAIAWLVCVGAYATMALR